MNYPLATLSDQFLTERRFVKDVSQKTLVWYRIAFRNYEQSFPPRTAPRLPTKHRSNISSFPCGSEASSPSRATRTSVPSMRFACGSIKRGTSRAHQDSEAARGASRVGTAERRPYASTHWVQTQRLPRASTPPECAIGARHGPSHLRGIAIARGRHRRRQPDCEGARERSGGWTAWTPWPSNTGGSRQLGEGVVGVHLDNMRVLVVETAQLTLFISQTVPASYYHPT